MGVSKMTGTPWHLETLKLKDGERKRHKSNCIYYSAETSNCIKRGFKCVGSAHCEKYVDKSMRIKNADPPKKMAKISFFTKVYKVSKKLLYKKLCPICNTKTLSTVPLNVVAFSDEKRTKYLGTIKEAYCKQCSECKEMFITEEALKYICGNESIVSTNLKIENLNDKNI